MKQIAKILFSGIGEKFETEIKKHLDATPFFYEFCKSADYENSIKEFMPDIIVTTISSFPEYEKQISHLKSAADADNIPLAVIVNRSNEEPYFFLVKNGITKIITSPVSRQDFLNYIFSFLCLEPLDSSVKRINLSSVKNSCTEIENYLISNLVIQNRMAKDLLKKTGPQHDSDKFKLEKFHSDKINELRIIEAKLWDAYDYGYFRLYYQPVISLDSGKLAGFEALIRIIHPEEGLISPADFIDVAENSAIIFPLGLWIIEEACRQINEWKNTFFLDTPLRINVNLSAKQFIHPELTSHIFEITERLEINEHDIAFELTESAFMEDMESANIALLELRSKKFALYMDDFGTGYSSLSYLMHFPVNVIKIDQSFVKWMHIDEQSETLVKSLVALAHNLGLKVVAEGTDDESHIEILKNCGCDYAQGYYFAKPLPAEDAAKFISDHFEKK
jgi:EAL domain-containing protein (putative c-di-GMP-specific phosphodiesterase class I)